jgi:hypothetical protein
VVPDLPDVRDHPAHGGHLRGEEVVPHLHHPGEDEHHQLQQPGVLPWHYHRENAKTQEGL